MNRAPQYRGVSYIRGARKPWKAAITRCGLSLWLGSYLTAAEAADAADNGAYYTKQWARHNISLNHPDKWADGVELPKPHRYTHAAISLIKEKVPDLAGQIEKSKVLTPAERLEETADLIAGHIIHFAEQLRTELRVAAGTLRIVESDNAQQREEIARLERVIKSLQNTGGNPQFFKKVGTELTVATEVDHHLDHGPT